MKFIPNHVLEDEGFCRRMIVAVGEAVARAMDESEWKKFAICDFAWNKDPALGVICIQSGPWS